MLLFVFVLAALAFVFEATELPGYRRMAFYFGLLWIFVLTNPKLFVILGFVVLFAALLGLIFKRWIYVR